MQQEKFNSKQIDKLEKEIADFERELTIQAKQKQLIKNYKMKQGDYQILISIYQANQLMPRGTDFWIFKTNKTACDAFVQIEIRDQIQKTTVKKDTNNPIFDEKFYFQFKAMTLQQLDKASITFRLYDKKQFILRDSLIGSFQVDWTNVYFKRNHQIYRGWLTLMDPFDEEEGVMGYLLVSIAVLGENDKVTVHDSAFIKDPLTTIQDTVTMPKLQLIDYGIEIQIYRAQNLVPLDEYAGNVDAYVIAKFSGNKMDTSVKTSCNPQWDQLIKIGTAVPTKSKYVLLQVRNRNYMFGDDIIGVLKIPFVDLKEQSQPRWGHLYGPPVSGKDIQPYNFATKMQIHGEQMGSHYRGRLLYKITGHKDSQYKNSRSKINFKFPFKPTPVVPLKSYTLRLQVLDGFNLPQIKNKGQCYIHCCLGQYMIMSKSFGEVKNKTISFLEKLPDKKVQLPQDHSQIPDLIIYLAKGEKQKDRISYIRIPAKNIISMSNNNSMAIYNLKADLTLNNISKDECGGYLTARAHLFTGQPPENKISLLYEFGQKVPYILRIYIYRARNLPPMNERGDVDPKLVFSFCGVQQKRVTDSTYNPIWNQIVDMEVTTQNFMNLDIEKALICNVYDVQEKGRDNLIGNFMIKLSKKFKRKYRGFNKKIQFIYQKPQWYPILNEKVDIGDPCFGHVLLGCAVFKKEDSLQIKTFRQNDTRIIKQLSQNKSFQLFLLGARGLEQSSGHLDHKYIYFEVKVGKNKQKISKEAEVKQNSANINQMVPFEVQVPKNKCIVPFVDIKVFEKKGGVSKFIGFTSISLYQLVPKILKNLSQSKKQQKQNNEDQQASQQEQSQDTILNLDELQRQLSIVRERKRKRLQILKDLEQKKQKQKIKNVEQMKAPKELTSTTVCDSQQRNQKLDQLLQNFIQGYQKDPNFSYVLNLQHQRDIDTQQKMIEKRSSQISQANRTIKEQKNEEDEQNQLINGEQQNTNKMIKIQSNTAIDVFGKFGLHRQNQSYGFKEQPRKSETMYRDRNEQKKNKKIKRKLSKLSQLEKVREKVAYNNSDQSAKDDFIDIITRFGASQVQRKMLATQMMEEQKTISNFDMDVNEQINQVSHDERAIKYKDLQRIIKQEEKFTKQAMQRQQNYKYAAAVKLSLFKWKQKQKDIDVETYLDYDTDPEENLDIIPQWYKGRKILAADFEELVPNKKIRSLPIYQGGNRIGNLDIRQKKIVGYLKCIGLVADPQILQHKQRQYIKLLKPRSYVCRVYILKGKSLISNLSRKPTTYLKLYCKGQTYDLKETTLQKEQYNPEYYVCQQIPMDIPGSSTVRIEVVQQFNTLGVAQNKILGYTQIDIQERHFTKKWHLFTEKKPIELRNLYSEYGNGTQGRLQVWIDIIEKKNWFSNPPYKIHPPPFEKFQLRVIVWSTKECVYKNQAFQSNDVYVRGFLGTSEPQQTDTHWACRGTGNFNYRFKFQVSYPPKPEDMYSDQFVVQIWDRDLVGYNNLIGEKRINLNKIHRIIEKAVKRKRPVKAKMKIREQGLALTQKFWFDVYNHKVKDQFGQLQPQGKVQLSFQLVPKQKADNTLKNGFGRSDPNVFPTLQQPAGRLNFNILHPLDFFKQLCGPQLYNSICHKVICCIVLIVIALLLYFVAGSLISSAIISSSVNKNNNNNNNNTNN